eukprot:m.7433 g.7433  ORF g.7433 m.7433 type:complete len:103 (+) comp3714_c0_seq1:38-346(+)
MKKGSGGYDSSLQDKGNSLFLFLNSKNFIANKNSLLKFIIFLLKISIEQQQQSSFSILFNQCLGLLSFRKESLLYFQRFLGPPSAPALGSLTSSFQNAFAVT